MPTVTIQSDLHAAQRRVLAERRRYNVLACGRRWGKTTLGLDVATETAAVDAKPVAWFAPTYRSLADVWREMVEVLQPITRRALASEHRLELVTGGVIDMWSMDAPDTARGRAYARVILDEAAMAPTLADAWPNVIRPMLADYRGDAWFMSTPKGRGYYWQLWRAGQEGLDGWASWQMPTASNPFIAASEIDEARRQLPERTFAQEYLAHFIEDAGLVFRGVTDAQTAQAQAGRLDGHDYVIGLDWAKLHDWTVAVVVDAETREQCYLDRFNQASYEVQLDRVKAIVERFRPSVILAESNSIGEPLLDRLRRDGITVHSFTTTAHSKAGIIEGLALGIERGALRLLPDTVQEAELLAFEAERLPSGMVRYGAPAGYHDDCVMALALAWRACGEMMPEPVKGHDPFAVLRDDGTVKIDLRRGSAGGLRFGVRAGRAPTLEFT